MEGEVITLPATVRVQARPHRCRTVSRSATPLDGSAAGFLPKFKRHGIELPDEIFGTLANAIFGVNGDERHGELGPGRSTQ